MLLKLESPFFKGQNLLESEVCPSEDRPDVRDIRTVLHPLPPSAFDTSLNVVVAEKELCQEFLVLLVVAHVAGARRSWSTFTMPTDLLGALGLCASLHGEAGLGGSLGQFRNVPLGDIAVGLLNVIDVGDPLWNQFLRGLC